LSTCQINDRVERQRVFDQLRIVEIVRGIVPDSWFRAIVDRWEHYVGTGQQKWDAIKDMALPEGPKRKFKETPAYAELVFSFTFPRLDAHVTTTMNHLLKSPFSYHPKSGFISVPIRPDLMSRFPPSWVPSLKKLISHDPDALETFKDCVTHFKKFVLGTVTD
jgi:DNA primase catalytic subunit